MHQGQIFVYSPSTTALLNYFRNGATLEPFPEDVAAVPQKKPYCSMILNSLIKWSVGSWRWLFWINVPLGIIIAVILAISTPNLGAIAGLRFTQSRRKSP